MGWSAADIPDQHGRTAVVTGANGGLGLETARQLAAKGAHVVMAVRNQKKAGAAVEEIRAGAPDASLELVALDLASQASVRAAAAYSPSSSSMRDSRSAISRLCSGVQTWCVGRATNSRRTVSVLSWNA